MKIRPVILCGGSGTRLWSDKKHHQPKQFIDFGNWTLFGKTLERIKNSIFDYPVISTNKKYIKEIKKHLKLKGFKKYKIILEPAKRNTAPAILSSALIKEISENQPLIFLTSDHLIQKTNLFYKSIKKHQKYLTDKNIFIFGIFGRGQLRVSVISIDTKLVSIWFVFFCIFDVARFNFEMLMETGQNQITLIIFILLTRWRTSKAPAKLGLTPASC